MFLIFFYFEKQKSNNKIKSNSITYSVDMIHFGVLRKFIQLSFLNKYFRKQNTNILKLVHVTHENLGHGKYILKLESLNKITKNKDIKKQWIFYKSTILLKNNS